MCQGAGMTLFACTPGSPGVEEDTYRSEVGNRNTGTQDGLPGAVPG